MPATLRRLLLPLHPLVVWLLLYEVGVCVKGAENLRRVAKALGHEDGDGYSNDTAPGKRAPELCSAHMLSTLGQGRMAVDKFLNQEV